MSRKSEMKAAKKAGYEAKMSNLKELSKTVQSILRGCDTESETRKQRDEYLDEMNNGWREGGIVIEFKRGNRHSYWDISFEFEAAFKFMKGSRVDDRITIKFYDENTSTEKQLELLTTLLHKDLKAVIGAAKVRIDMYAHKNGLIEIVISGTRNSLYKIGLHLFTNSTGDGFNFITPRVDDYINDYNAWGSHCGYEGYLEDRDLEDSKETRKEWNTAMRSFGWTDGIVPLRGKPLDKTQRKYAECDWK